MKRVSVCMATCNGALFIEEQIQSILNQLTSDDELIISDDKSTDATLQLIESIHDQRIRLVPSQPYKSPARNFENALMHAEGMFIFLSDQDDVWYPGKVQAVLATLTKYNLVVTDCQIVDMQGNKLHDSFLKAEGVSGVFGVTFGKTHTWDVAWHSSGKC